MKHLLGTTLNQHHCSILKNRVRPVLSIRRSDRAWSQILRLAGNHEVGALAERRNTVFLCFQSTHLLNQRSPLLRGSFCFLNQKASFSGVLASDTKLTSLELITNKVSVCLDMSSSSTDTRRSISDADEPPDPDADADVDVEGGVAE